MAQRFLSEPNLHSVPEGKPGELNQGRADLLFRWRSTPELNRSHRASIAVARALRFLCSLAVVQLLRWQRLSEILNLEKN